MVTEETKNPITPFGPIGYITFKRTYARRLIEDDPSSPTEEFYQTIDRALNACETQLKVGFTPEEFAEARNYLLGLKCSIAGRFLWQLGTKTVDKLGLLSLQNCALVVVNEPIKPFVWAFDALMLGSGVGFNIQRENVHEIPRVKFNVSISRKDTKDADFIVPDSREGWVELLRKVLDAHFFTGKDFTYSTICIRGKGVPIKGFGGASSGPEELCGGIAEINKILNTRVNKKLRPIDCLDIMNIIGSIVVSGNVRRSAQIAIGDQDDLQYLNAKRWDKGNIPNWRAMSNNSVVCNDIAYLPEQFWQGYNGNGEPYGLINLKLARAVGRIGETKYPDPDVAGFNPSLRKGTKIWTLDGVIPIELLENKKFKVRNLNGEIVEAFCWLSGKNKQLYEITLDNDIKYYCTAEHKWPIYTEQGWVKCETTDLKAGHLLPIVQHNSLEFGTKGNYSDGFLIGWLYGDGWITKRTDNEKIQYGWIISSLDKESNIHNIISEKLNEITKNVHTGTRNRNNIEFNSASELLNEYMLSFGVSHKSNGLPTKIWTECSEEFRKGFIDAFYSSDGSIDCSYSSSNIIISQSNKKLIDDLGDLLGFYGIKCSFNNSIVENAVFPNGKNYNKQYKVFKLKISTRQSIEHFKNIFKLSVKHKQQKLNKISTLIVKPLWGKTREIKSIKLTDIYEDVWDIHVKDNTHCFQLSNCITGNCGEQSLANYETCCLAEVFLPNIASLEELKKVSTYLYRINKHSLMLDCHHPETERIVHKNMRMGVSMTGYLQATEEQKSWLTPTYEHLRTFDVEYSKKMGWPKSIKITTVKPSGTLSLLPGVTPGCHPGYCQYFIRRVRVSSNSPLVEICRQHGYSVEFQKNFDGTQDRNTVVVSFPCSYPEGTVFAKDVRAIDQLEVVKRLQTEWSDNSVSCTVYYKKEELPDIQEWLKNNYNKNIKSISFLLHSDHGFVQAPYEEITEEEYKAMIKKVKPITSGSIDEDDGLDSFECQTGACPIK